MSTPRARCCLFFFQAEDGIRDVAVTGVQTCALPICARPAGPGDGVSDAAQDRCARPAALGGGLVSTGDRMQGAQAFDLARVVCRLTELERQGARSFVIGAGDWPLRGFVVRVGDAVRGYVNRCPHAGHPLNLLPDRFLTCDGALILCSSHGALFEKSSGYCVAGPCAGRALTPVALELRHGYVLLADSVAAGALAQAAW